MTFTTLDYLLFLPVVVILYYLLPHKFRNPLLLVGSYYFYACYNLPLVLYLLLVTIVTYCIGRKIGSSESTTKKRWVVLGILLMALSLVVYKYTDFIIGIFSKESAGFDLLAPLGVSFITFSAISYLADVHKGVIAAERNLFHFSLFMSFFPKVVQGPIVKYKDLSDQFMQRHDWDSHNFRTGIIQVIYGLFMKMVIADRLAVAVNTVYNSADKYSGFVLTLATALFALQIYFDFAGYSLTAIGSARLLGFHLADNFQQPYLSSSVGEFWRRWHISLNKWLTDYIYIPLGGSRCSHLRRDVNLLVTFGISGLWHGANWGYLIWGLLNGAYIVIEKRIQEARTPAPKVKGKKTLPPKKRYPLLGQIITFILVSFSWIFFRAQTLSASATVVSRIFTRFNLSGGLRWAIEQFSAEDPSYLGLTPYSWIVLIVALLVNWVVDVAVQKHQLVDKFSQAKLPIRWIIYLVLLFSIILFGMYGYGYSAASFIYAAF